MKKLLAMALALVLALGLAVPALAEEAGTFYVDGEAADVYDEYEAVPISDEIPVDDDYDLDCIWDEPKEEPTLTLVVNGVASDVTVTAENGVSYVDADALRSILGEKAVGGDVTPVPVRAATEAAGWDVTWYAGDWRGEDQQVCLWDRETILAELKTNMEPTLILRRGLEDLLRAAVETETAQRTVENATVRLKRFDTLNEDKTYTFQLGAETVRQKGVVDCTVTANAAQLVDCMTPLQRASLLHSGGEVLDKLRAVLTDCKLEVILDYNAGAAAYSIPYLELVGGGRSGWQGGGIGDLDGLFATEADLARQSYEELLERCEWLGGVDAWEWLQYEMTSRAAYMGPDNVKVEGDKVTYTLTTKQVNDAFKAILCSEDVNAEYDMFQAFDVKCVLDGKGGADLELTIRPDEESVARFNVDLDGEWTLPFGPAMELTLSGHMDKSKANVTATLHQKNSSVLELKLQSSTSPSSQGPRQVQDVLGPTVLPAGE